MNSQSYVAKGSSRYENGGTRRTVAALSVGGLGRITFLISNIDGGEVPSRDCFGVTMKCIGILLLCDGAFELGFTFFDPPTVHFLSPIAIK